MLRIVNQLKQRIFVFGGYSIDKSTFKYILKNIPEGGHILEFGSGYATKKLLEHYNVTSIEDNPKWIMKVNNTKYQHKTYLAPLVDGWFDLGIVADILFDPKYDLILIDAPIGEYRINLPVKIFRNVKCPVIFDDTNRTDDYNKMMEFCEKLDFKPEIFFDKNKHWTWCTKIDRQ